MKESTCVHAHARQVSLREKPRGSAMLGVADGNPPHVGRHGTLQGEKLLALGMDADGMPKDIRDKEKLTLDEAARQELQRVDARLQLEVAQREAECLLRKGRIALAKKSAARFMHKGCDVLAVVQQRIMQHRQQNRGIAFAETPRLDGERIPQCR